MRTRTMQIAPVLFGLMFGGAVMAANGHGECPDAGTSQAPGDCKPLTRAEVKAELEAAGARSIDVGECPDAPAGPTATGKMRTRAEVKKEAAEAARTGSTLDVGACPK